MFKKLVAKIFQKENLFDLQAEAISCAKWYIKNNGMDGLPLEQKTQILNMLIHGYMMGHRKCEEKNGFTEKSGVRYR